MKKEVNNQGGGSCQVKVVKMAGNYYSRQHFKMVWKVTWFASINELE